MKYLILFILFVMLIQSSRVSIQPCSTIKYEFYFKGKLMFKDHDKKGFTIKSIHIENGHAPSKVFQYDSLSVHY